jgi:recombination protein RecT
MSNQIVPRQPTDLRLVIQSEKIQEQLIAALPRHYTPDQFTTIVRTQINRNPKLAECDQGSFLTAMITAAQMGIAPDGRNGHLIPRFNGKAQRTECTFQPDYKGLVGLVRKNENVADIYAEVVYDNDSFKVTKGLHRDLIHEQDPKRERGEAIGAYAVIAYKDGSHSWEWMPRQDIENVRNRSDSWKAHVSKGYDTPWKTDEGEMFKKTALKRLIKLADISQETSDRLAVDPEFTPAPQPVQVEIKAAALPALPALPEPDQIPMESATSAEPIRPRGRPKKFLKQQEPEIEPQTEAPVQPNEPEPVTEINLVPAGARGEIMQKLANIGKTEADLIRVCAAAKFCDQNSSLADIPEATLNEFVTYWDELEDELKK